VKKREGRAGDKPADDRPDAWEIAVRLLAMRALSSEELRRRLARRGVPPGQISATLAKLTASRYLDDAEYARAWARSRAHRRSLGPTRLAQELRAKGLAEGEIAGALREAYTERGAQEVAEAAAVRRLPALQGLPPDVARRRLAGYLRRRGFAVEIILALCRKHFPPGDDPRGNDH
jgi:regulatory protein